MINTSCPECTQKEDLNNKYLKLIKLLKAKCQKTAKSFAKNNTQPSDTLYESSEENSKSLHFNQRSNPLKSDLNPQKQTTYSTKTSQLDLALVIITNKCKKALLKHSFHKIKASPNVSLQTPTSLTPCSLNLQCSLPSIIQQALSYGKNMQQKSNFSLQSNKQLHSKIFNLQLENQFYLQKITSLQKLIKESQKRFLKQTQKKRQSLETVAQEIRQKTELVVELQQTIKRYQKTFGKSLQNITMESVLVQDTDELKRTCLRLQNINEKLNDDIRNLRNSYQILSKELLSKKSQNESLQKENKTLKQQNFDLCQSLTNHSKMQSIYKNSLKRFHKKISAVQQKQRQLYSSMKMNSQLINSANMVSTKNTEFSVQDVLLDKRQSLKQLQVEQKIEEIFSFLFHIKVENYRIENLHLFDQDEVELLKSHKEICLNQNREESFIEAKRQIVKKHDGLNQSNFFNTDQVFYLKKHQSPEENSFLCALDPTKTQIPQQPINPQINNMKLIQMQIEKSKLIQKISELKNLHMHIRNVVFNFLKVLDLNSLKPETEGILQIVFEFFQYSEDEKLSIFKEKKKKFWGIL